MGIIPKKEKRKLLNFKATEAERKAIQANADKYAGGSISAWLRFAGTKCKPSRKDLR